METVLLLESTHANGTSFAPKLQKRYRLLIAHSRQEVIDLVQEYCPSVIVLDTTAMRTSGNRLCAMLRQQLGNIPLIHIKSTPDEEASSADILLYQPLTYRKLLNRINRYTTPTQQDEILQVGAFCLNLTQGILVSPSGEHNLTPKLAKLMAVFMRQPESIIERRKLIKEVWQTDYMGDTRTLDVHIRWIRERVEQNASQPRYIRTVRGKGYRFIPSGDTNVALV